MLSIVKIFSISQKVHEKSAPYFETLLFVCWKDFNQTFVGGTLLLRPFSIIHQQQKSYSEL